MIEFPVTSASITGIAAAALSAFFKYFPVVRVWWAKRSTELKSGVTILVIISVAAIIYILDCNQIIATSITCDKQGIITLAILVITALTSNQSTWSVIKNLPDFKDVKIAKITLLSKTK